MPYKTDKQAIKDPFLDQRTKLLPCQKEMVVYWHNRGASQRALARMFHVSRRLIIFIIDPQRLKKNLERRQERGGTAAYYDKDKHSDYMKEHRRYKHKTLPDSDNIS